MKQNRDFHRQVRVVYRACRKLYGKEKTQDECLKVFKVVFPEMYSAKHSDYPTNRHLSENGIKKLDAIFVGWNIEEGGELRKLCDTVLGEAGRWRFNDDFVRFCEDIMPVVMRIRKLTPSECLKLMDMDDKDINTMMNCGLSNSSIYKLAGNSIVVSCMFHIFKKLFVETGPDFERGKYQQLTLF